MRTFQLLLLLAGVGLFIFFVQRVGLAEIAGGLSAIGWTFVTIFAIELVIDALHSEGWRWCLPPESRHVAWHHVFLARTAGVAVNVLTPTASVGGEVLKGVLLRRWVPPVDAFASVMVDKLSFAIGQTLFLVAGLAAVFHSAIFEPRERWLALGVLLAWGAAIGGFFALQRSGIVRAGAGALDSMLGGSALVERLPGQALAFDARVSELLHHHLGSFLLSVALHLAAQFARVAQYGLAMSALGLEPSLAACFTTAAGLVFMEATLFLVPAKLGVFEGGNALIFARFGFGTAAGLVVSFALRLSELASAALGLLALAYYQFVDRSEPVRPAGDPPAIRG